MENDIFNGQTPTPQPQVPPYDAPQVPPYDAPQIPPYGAPQVPPYGAPQVPPYGAPQVPPYGYQTPYAPQPTGDKKLVRQWWFWLIIAVAAIALVVGIISLTDGSSSSSSYSYTTPVSPYVTAVKTATNSNYGITYGAAFDRFFSNPSWRYFKADTGEDVVEFTGGFSYDGSPATAKIQFIVDLSSGKLEVYHLSINGVGQSRLMLAAMIKKVFESY